MYNFIKTNERKNAPQFKHKLFKRDHKELIYNIKRRPVNNSVNNKKLIGSSIGQDDLIQAKSDNQNSKENQEKMMESPETSRENKETRKLEELTKIENVYGNNLGQFYNEVFSFLKSFDSKIYQSLRRKGSIFTNEENQSLRDEDMINQLKEIRESLLKPGSSDNDIVKTVFDLVISRFQPKNLIDVQEENFDCKLRPFDQQIENQIVNCLDYNSNVYSPDIRLNHSEGGESLYQRIFVGSERDRLISNFISPLKRVKFGNL